MSPVGDIKIVSPISTSVLNTLTLKESAFFKWYNGMNLKVAGNIY